MGPEDRQAGIVERDEAHERVSMRPLTADLVRVDAGCLVAVMAVGDQQLGVGEAGRHRLVDGRLRDSPDTMDGALRVGHLAPRIAPDVGLDVTPDVAGMQREDRREVVARRPRQAQAVLLGAGLGALVGSHEARAVVGDPDPDEEAVSRLAPAIGGRVLLRQRPDCRLAVGGENAVERPGLECLRSVLVRVAAPGRTGQVDLHDVERRPSEELGPLSLVDDVVWRSGHVAERRDRREVVVERVERPDLCHGRRTLVAALAAGR